MNTGYSTLGRCLGIGVVPAEVFVILGAGLGTCSTFRGWHAHRRCCRGSGPEATVFGWLVGAAVLRAVYGGLGCVSAIANSRALRAREPACVCGSLKVRSVRTAGAEGQVSHTVVKGVPEA